MTDPLEDAVRKQQAEDATYAASQALLNQEAHDAVLDNMAVQFARGMDGAGAQPFHTSRTSTTSTWEKRSGLFGKRVEVQHFHVDHDVVCRGWTVADNYRFTKDVRYKGDMLVVARQGRKGDEIFIADNGTWHRASIGIPGTPPIYRGPVVNVNSPYHSVDFRDIIYGLREQLADLFGLLYTNDDNFWQMFEARPAVVRDIHERVAQVLAKLASQTGRTIV